MKERHNRKRLLLYIKLLIASIFGWIGFAFVGTLVNAFFIFLSFVCIGVMCWSITLIGEEKLNKALVDNDKKYS